MVLAGGMLDGRRFLSPAGVAALTTGGPSTGVGDARYGMGWVDAHPQRPTDDQPRRQHDRHGRPSRSSTRRPATPIVVLANAQAIPYELFGKIDMIGLGALDQMLGREPDGTLEQFYPIVDVVPDRARSR